MKHILYSCNKSWLAVALAQGFAALVFASSLPAALVAAYRFNTNNAEGL